MKNYLKCVSVFGFILLGGCAAQQVPIVAVSSFKDSNGIFPSANVTREPRIATVKGAEQESFKSSVASVRVCNKERTECEIGKAKFDSNVTVTSLGQKTAIVNVDFDYDIGDKQVVGTASPQGASGYKTVWTVDGATLNGRKVFSERAEIVYGTFHHFSLPYGAEFVLCVAKPGPKTLNLDPWECLP
ncbi:MULTISPECIES: hypothetical protein [unclassified Pseudomonas]|uniref:hypothetical protein n=1 Tax=unclassified Pseudomonas TaxID=196821 RepID=UPI001147479B|nr:MULTISPECIES: hypothetical protein [unclassified Pseudomonas]QJI38463.1 hypothetical protein HKK54_30055 [Pseudomonas sp. ADAK13]